MNSRYLRRNDYEWCGMFKGNLKSLGPNANNDDSGRYLMPRSVASSRVNSCGDQSGTTHE